MQNSGLGLGSIIHFQFARVGKRDLFKPFHFEDIWCLVLVRTGNVPLLSASFVQSLSASGPGPISLIPLCSHCLPQVCPEDDSASLGLPVLVCRWDQMRPHTNWSQRINRGFSSSSIEL